MSLLLSVVLGNVTFIRLFPIATLYAFAGMLVDRLSKPTPSAYVSCTGIG